MFICLNPENQNKDYEKTTRIRGLLQESKEKSRTIKGEIKNQTGKKIPKRKQLNKEWNNK